MVALRWQLDGLGFLVSQLHLQPIARGSDGHVAISQPAHEVKRFARGLLEREAQRVRSHRLLDGIAHLWRRAEESVRGHEPGKPLVRPPEVIGLHEELEATFAVGEVGKDGAREEFVPQRLPEALHFAQRHWVLRSALDVADAVLAQQLLEGRRAAPCRVLAPVVREHLPRRSVRGHGPLERLDGDAALLVVRKHVRDDEARVVVHEGRHVDALMASQQEGEDVRLPELVRLCALEAPFWWRHLWHLRRLVGQQPFVVQDAPHLRRRHTQRVEAPQAVRNLPRAEVREGLLHRHHRVALRVSPVRAPGLRCRTRAPRRHRVRTRFSEGLEPVHHRLSRDTEDARHLGYRQVFVHDAQHDAKPELRRIAIAIHASGLSSLRLCFPSHRVTSLLRASGQRGRGAAKGFGANSGAHQLARTTCQ
jgi:hypothetical protein